MIGQNGISLPNAIAIHFPSLSRGLRSLGVQFTLGGGGDFVHMYAWIIILLPVVFLAPNTQELLAGHRPGIGAPKASPVRWRCGAQADLGRWRVDSLPPSAFFLFIA